MKIKISFLNLFLLICGFSFAQEPSKDVTITASGSGKTLEEAKQSALRSATEQAFGAFISSKTEIFNDQVVADQMSSVSSGNIKSFEVLNEAQLPNNNWAVTIKAIVSVDKLTSFVQAKGIAIEVKGGLFAINVKQQLLNEQGEVNSVMEMVGVIHEAMQTAFDYTIQSGEPKSLDVESKNWAIPLVVTATCNKNIDFCANYFKKTLSALSLTSADVKTYKSLNKQVFPINFKYLNQETTFYLRKETSIEAINTLISNKEFYSRLFSVQSGMDQSFGIGEGHLSYMDNNFDTWETKTISFPTAGNIAGTFTWNDKKTLSQIEQLSGYQVKPRGVVSFIKNGGYVLNERNGHGIVVSICDLGIVNFQEANIMCDDASFLGYKDWYLPSWIELRTIDAYSGKLGIARLFNGYYWTSSRNDIKQAGNQEDVFIYDSHRPNDNRISVNIRFQKPYDKVKVRPVRKF